MLTLSIARATLLELDETMPASATVADALHALVLTRLIDVPCDKLFHCWTEPSPHRFDPLSD